MAKQKEQQQNEDFVARDGFGTGLKAFLSRAKKRVTKQFKINEAERLDKINEANINAEYSKGFDKLKNKIKYAALSAVNTALSSTYKDVHLHKDVEIKNGVFEGMSLHRNKDGKYFFQAEHDCQVPDPNDPNKKLTLEAGQTTGLYNIKGYNNIRNFAAAVNSGDFGIFVEKGSELTMEKNITDPNLFNDTAVIGHEPGKRGSNVRLMDQSRLDRSRILSSSIDLAGSAIGTYVKNSNVAQRGDFANNMIVNTHIGGAARESGDSYNAYHIGDIADSRLTSSQVQHEGNLLNVEADNTKILGTQFSTQKGGKTDVNNNYENVRAENAVLYDVKATNSYLLGVKAESSQFAGTTANMKDQNEFSNSVFENSHVESDAGSDFSAINVRSDRSFFNARSNTAQRYNGLNARLAAFIDNNRFNDANIRGFASKNKDNSYRSVAPVILQECQGDGVRSAKMRDKGDGYDPRAVNRPMVFGGVAFEPNRTMPSAKDYFNRDLIHTKGYRMSDSVRNEYVPTFEKLSENMIQGLDGNFEMNKDFRANWESRLEQDSQIMQRLEDTAYLTNARYDHPSSNLLRSNSRFNPVTTNFEVGTMPVKDWLAGKNMDRTPIFNKDDAANATKDVDTPSVSNDVQNDAPFDKHNNKNKNKDKDIDEPDL